MALAVVRPIISFERAASPLAQQRPTRHQSDDAGLRAVRPRGFRAWPTGVPRGTRRLGSGLNDAAWGAMSRADVSSLFVAGGNPSLSSLRLVHLPAQHDVREAPRAPSNSFVANCREYATVSGSQAADSIISERCVVGLGVCRAWVPSPASRLCGSKARRAPRQAPGIADFASTTHDTRRVFSQVCGKRLAGRLAAEAWGSPFARERLTVHQSGTAAGARRPKGIPREGPPAFHVKPGGDTRTGDRAHGSRCGLGPSIGSRTNASEVVVSRTRCTSI